MEIRFLGADRQVTGSCYALEASGRRFLVDCGLYQERSFLDRNWEPFPIPPDSIDDLLLTHAHLDHCGLIPRLVTQGFSGRILATPATIDLAKIVLLDSANIQEEDAAYKRKRHAREGRPGPHPEIPLYTVQDAERSFPFFEPVAYGRPVKPAKGFTAVFHDAGHILGAAMLDLRVQEKSGDPRRIVFSGDMGPWDKPLVRDPSVFDKADIVVMESTYGDRDHDDPGRIDDLLAETIVSTAARGGNVVIPVFAMERAQEVLYYLARLVRENRIPRLPVFLDSPMAIEVVQVFKRYPALLDEEAKELIRAGRPLLEFPGLRLTKSTQESKAINRLEAPCVILAGSGMATAGRIKHHLLGNIGRAASTVLFVGYQAPGTLGRQILDGAAEVRILGQILKVRARIAKINGFSGHAGRRDLRRWLASFREKPERLFLCHGEESTSLAFAAELEAEGWPVTVPRFGDTSTL
jgi:metallo-beta-lactamase family protein